MSKNHVSQPKGLILLVVLGMLALFSLLSVTYVVFASQSRASSVALARHSIRDSKTKDPLFQEAIMQLIRGTTDLNSAINGHSLLGDLYGDIESAPFPLSSATRMLSIRDVQFNATTGATSPMTYDATTGTQRPMLLGGTMSGSTYIPGKFLRIPLDPGLTTYGLSTLLPNEHDALTGRIVTFEAGPLQGLSFHIVRYIGHVPLGSPPQEFMQCFSIVIDLSEADLARTYSTRDSATGVLLTSTINEWVLQVPPVTGVSTWAAGVYPCYQTVSLNPASMQLSGGFRLFVNATALNTHGVGILNDGTSQMHAEVATATAEPYLMSAGLLANRQMLFDPAFGSLLDPSTGSSTSTLLGDSDEPYDAADFQNLFLASRPEVTTTPLTSGDIIPSFHRAALINYIVNWKDPATYTEAEFRATLQRIRMACPRPLSINVTTPTMGSIVENPTFSDGRPATSLVLNVGNPWNTNWPAAYPTFQSWLNFLTAGPWDVDNDGDTIADGVWIDLGMPLQSTADGKLLKALVSYYVDDLDSRIDINATGSVQQANMVGLFDSTTTPFVFPPYSASNPQFPATAFSKGNLQYLNQGLGFGSADTSFRHLFGKTGLRWNGASGADAAEVAYRNVMFHRYSRTANPTEMFPGDTGDDGLSLLSVRGRRVAFRHGVSPGLPMHVTGRASLGLDRLGNPFLHNVELPMDESTNDPYEARLVSNPHKDRPFSLSEWERIYRVSDSDRSALPSRVEELFGETSNTIASSNLKQEITTISRHLRVPMLATRSQPSVTAPTSFFQLVNTIRQLRGQPSFTYDQFGILFPLEFHRGLPLDVNRPFGNGIDDNGDGEIDEPSELLSPQAAIYLNASGALQATGTPEDYFYSKAFGNTGVMGAVDFVDITDPAMRSFPPAAPFSPIYRGNETRQMFARHLYCLAQLIVPEDYVFPNVDRNYFLELLDVSQTGIDPAKMAATDKLLEIRSRTLAQWAVNVVDFRDSDATMTRFPYDPTPFDGTPWAPTAVVWGLEQPELLLTESLATHDIRVKRDALANPARFDQYRTPQGSLFLELFCPRTTNTNTSAAPFTAANTTAVPGVPSSLYSVTGAGDVFLDLGRLTPDYSSAGVAERFPVWRIYISNSIDKSGTTPALKTPHERLIAPPPTTAASPTRNDLTYQLPTSNLIFDSSGNPVQALDTIVRPQSGLTLDRANAMVEVLADPDVDESRIILFARAPNGTDPFLPTRANTPGVKDPIHQVFVNRSGALSLRGNQYLVVGPREKTFFGSRRNAKTTSPSPNNVPNNHRIELGTNWTSLVMTDQTVITQRPALRDCVTMIAGADLPAGWPGLPDTVDFIGVNVSEPLPRDTGYYAMPTQKVNSGDNTDDAGQTLEPGFANLPDDAYHDYATPGAPGLQPFDPRITGPLEHWDVDGNGTAADVLAAANGVVQPGTVLDWSTAYLQRLADPEKPWDATFNPYITVDWMPIDLTVFSGEDNEDTNSELTGTTLKFASRQKVGQTLNAQTLSFNATAAGLKGQTFLSSLTDEPQDSTPLAAPTTHLKFELAGDSSATRPSNADGTNSFSTFGFLNSTFVLAGESGLTGLPVLPDIYQGAPGDPAGTNLQWHPDSLFWANRQFANSLEIMNVPLSSPGQLLQEFSGTLFPTTKHSMYAASFTNELTATFAENDPRMPSAPISTSTMGPYKGRANDSASFPSYTIAADGDNKGDFAFSPFSHLMNFFQESPELATPSPFALPTDRHPKNTAMALLLDMMETESAWNDVSVVEPPAPLGLVDPTIYSSDVQPLMYSTNVVMAPLRAPYNRISRYVEPGRINLNTVRQSSVFQGLWSNTLVPTDVDFEPYATPGRPFGQIEDIDHNQNDINEGGERGTPQTLPGSVTQTAWSVVRNSRRGYEPTSGFFNPGGSTTRFNPNYPTEFAGIFKPATEAGLVARTRAPQLATPGPTQEEQKFQSLVNQHGVLDLYARQIPAHVTLLRGTTETSTTSTAIAATGVPYAGNAPLLQDITLTQRQAFTDRYPITRLANLVSNRSNVFAVYVTIGLFEYDEATGNIGIEYGTDKGEMERFKAFYIIDRTVPVGFRTGEDHNVENTILVRRYLNN